MKTLSIKLTGFHTLMPENVYTCRFWESRYDAYILSCLLSQR